MCTSPAGSPGELDFNATGSGKFEYCNDLVWVSIDASVVQPVNTGLLAYWKFNETSGTSVIDSSGNNYTGNWNGSTSVESFNAIHETGFYFDNVDNFINFGDILDFNYSDTRTFTAWIKADSFRTDGNTDAIITKQEFGSSYDGWGFELTRNGKIRIEYTVSPTSNQFSAVTDDAISLGKWHHVVGVYKNQTAKFYVDGELVPSSIVRNSISSNLDTSYDLNIGVRFNDANGNSRHEFHGLIDEVRIYSLELSAEEIRVLAFCNMPGKMGYNFSDHVIQWCDINNDLYNAGAPGSGGSGCSATGSLSASKEGGIQYDFINNKMVFCDGINFVPMPN